MVYSINDIDESFYNDVMDELNKMLKKHLRLFVENIEINKFKPVEKYDPVERKKVKFPNLLSYQMKMIYYYITEDIPSTKVKLVFEYFDKITKLVSRSILKEINDSNIKKVIWSKVKNNSKLGFFMYVTYLRRKLEEGDNFNAEEAGVLVGVSGERIRQMIKSDINKIYVKYSERKYWKSGNEWIIQNKVVKDLLYR